MVVNQIGTYCGLCGKQGFLIQTECCERFICDPSHNGATPHILDICTRNHREYTLCGLHKKERHQEACDWRDCSKCEAHLKPTERFVGYGTNRYNFDGENWKPPTFEPTHCAQCGILMQLNIITCIGKADGRMICSEHQEIPLALATRLFGNAKVESFGMS